ncbi:cell adhesion molecule DSCAM isoform X2 [Cylas formicarius]|uniref:cell adhesion molecule DSCAM isoform X2 n=1 Tax=Cylas formicarius TaxID=197179 RepID=UPI002958AF24|nr:cell adhesion molecule DSCAM isoform X2 [Cylas formicarius]
MCKKPHGIFLFLCLTVIQGSQIVLKKLEVDIGKNVTLRCPVDLTDVMWVKENRTDDDHARMKVFSNGTLFIMHVNIKDSGAYSCRRANVVESPIQGKVQVRVRSPPLPLNVTIKTSTVLAVVFWTVQGNGGYPIINFTAQYRLAYTNDSWLPISPNHITPNSRQVDVYNLRPNTTYEFRIWATNQLGRSPSVSVYGVTLDSYKETGADQFDTRIWAAAVGVVMGTLVLLGIGTCILLYQECKTPTVEEEQEIIELVPNIILNPGFDDNQQNMPAPDENSNNEHPQRLNNNSVVQPQNV